MDVLSGNENDDAEKGFAKKRFEKPAFSRTESGSEIV